MSASIKIVFFGSTSDSVIVLSRLIDAGHAPVAVVTQPAAPHGRKQVITPTPVEVYAKEHAIPVLSFRNNPEKPWLYEHEEDAFNNISTFKPDLLVSASYGQKIPLKTIQEAQFGGLNIHPSLLPKWRGADPVPWTILSGDRQTGVTVVTLTEKFDQGRIIAQKKIDVLETDVSDRLRAALFTYGADLLIESLPAYLSGHNKGSEQKQENGSVARKLKRDDGSIPWNCIQSAMENPTTIEQCNNEIMFVYMKKQNVGFPQNLLICTWVLRMLRSLSPWPGVWTIIKIKNEEMRVKILEAHKENDKLILDSVQLEGKKPVKWKQFEKNYNVK